MKWLVLPLALVCMTPMSAHAALVITKIVSNPVGPNAGRQWIEISSNGTDSIDLGAKNIRFFTTSGNHLIKAYDNGGTVLNVGGTAVIAQNPLSFLFDMPNYSGLLVKSAFTLPATGIVGITQTDGTVLVQKSYVSPPTPSVSSGFAKKPASTSKSTNKRATSRTTSASKSKVTTKANLYGKGTVAPAASADADAAGAVFALPSALAPLAPLFSTVWFALYLALLAFSGFSLLVIQRHYYV